MRLFVLALAAALVIGATSEKPHQFVATANSIPNARIVRVLARSEISLVSDLYWIRMAGMASRISQPVQGLELLAWGQFITDLDPSFYWAYVVGGIMGPVRIRKQVYNGVEAEALLKKGTAHSTNPRMFLHLAFAQLDLLGHYADAAETLKQGALLPTAPDYFGPLATRLLAQAGQLDAARAFATQMANQGDPETRQVFKDRIEEINREEWLTAIEAAAQSFKREHGHLPTVAELRPSLSADIPGDFLDHVTLNSEGVASAGAERLRVFLPKEGLQ